MDISETTIPKSDQQQYDDYLGGQKRTVTVTGVTKGSLEQPVNVELAEFPGRPFRPNKTMRRLLVLAWGTDSTAYIGRQLTLFGNPEVVFGGKAVGGVEIAAMSHIEKPLTVPLTVTRAKKKNFTVQPIATIAPALTAAPTIDPATLLEWADAIAAADTLPALQAVWGEAGNAKVTGHPAIVAAKDKRKTELQASS